MPEGVGPLVAVIQTINQTIERQHCGQHYGLEFGQLSAQCDDLLPVNYSILRKKVVRLRELTGRERRMQRTCTFWTCSSGLWLALMSSAALRRYRLE